MNERIKQLAEQAGVYFGEAHTDYFGEEHPAYVSIQDMDFEKFAELIVGECIKVVDDTMTENQEMNIGLVMASAAIVAHFEVEE
jgi:hypothetical protein